VKVFNLPQRNHSSGIGSYYKSKNNVCILRKSGGLGDLLLARVLFENLKNQYPEFNYTFAIPNSYQELGKNHPYISNVIDYNSYNSDDYVTTFDITTCCAKYESINRIDAVLNRCEIWANHIGVNIEKFNMFLPNFINNKQKFYEKLKMLGYKDGQKIVAFSPYSAVPIRNLTSEVIKNIIEVFSHKDIFLFVLNHIPILELNFLPFIKGFNFLEVMLYVQLSDAIITTDTGILHCAGGYEKNTIGIFNYTNGKVVGKFYKNMILVQKNSDNDKDWKCGPCNDYNLCKYPVVNHTLECARQINKKMIDEAAVRLYEKLSIKH